MLKARRGLTVLELVIVVVIIGVLLLIVVPRFTAPSLVSVATPDSVVAPNATGEVAVKVTSRRGAPQRGVKIQFESAGHVTVTPAEVETDSTGTAKATWRASADTGALRIVAHPAGKTTPELVITSKIVGTVTTTPTPASAAPAQQLDSTATKKDSSASSAGASQRPTAPAETPAATKRP